MTTTAEAAAGGGGTFFHRWTAAIASAIIGSACLTAPLGNQIQADPDIRFRTKNGGWSSWSWDSSRPWETTVGWANRGLTGIELLSSLGQTGIGRISIFGNQLTHGFTAQPGAGKNIKHLTLNNNELTSFVLPDVWPNLEWLNVGGNQLTEFRSITRKLKFLYLANNQLTGFSFDEDSNERDLETINLSHNRLTSMVFPNNMPHLLNLHLNDNQLTEFSLPGAPKLRYLSLQNNQLENFRFLSNGSREKIDDTLRHFHISHNQLTSITLSKEEMSELMELRLNDNQLTSISLPERMPALIILDLSGNRLTSLTLPAGYSRLRVLDLEGNQLTNLVLPEGMTNLQDLYLDRNPLKQLLVPNELALGNVRIVYGSGLGRRAYYLTSDNLPFQVQFYEPPYEPPSIVLPIVPSPPPIEPPLPPVPIEPTTLSIVRKDGGVEIVFSGGTLQSSPTINGPWQDVSSSGRHLIVFSPSLPAEFFRIKPAQ